MQDQSDHDVHVINFIILPVTYVKSRSKPSFLYLRLFWETCRIEESKSEESCREQGFGNQSVVWDSFKSDRKLWVNCVASTISNAVYGIYSRITELCSDKVKLYVTVSLAELNCQVFWNHYLILPLAYIFQKPTINFLPGEHASGHPQNCDSQIIKLPFPPPPQ